MDITTLEGARPPRLERFARRYIVISAALALAACRADSTKDVEQAVRSYLDRVIAAYRSADASLVDPLVNDEQGLKVTGLIGVKRDAGVALDAKVLDLQFTRVERRGDLWIAETRERWYYLDRSLKNGQKVGDDSTDSYTMRYTFSHKRGRWLLENLEFVEAPVVGRKVAPLPMDGRTLHGLPPTSEEASANHAAPLAGHGRPESPRP